MLNQNSWKFVLRQVLIYYCVLLAGFLLSLFLFTTTYAADLDSIINVSHGGVVISEGDTVERNDLLSISTIWQAYFSWPHSVYTPETLFAVFRGEFGDIEGGVAINGLNYGATNQAWPAGQNTIGKYIGLPPLGDINTTSSTYTVLIAETLNNFNFQDTADWFASGGISGIEPVNYSTLTFIYDATPNPIDLNSIQEIVQGGRVINDGDLVLKKEITSTNSFWFWKFDWPNSVSNTQALFAVFRGEFGDIDGGEPLKNVNYSYNYQVFGSGQNTVAKSMGFPLANSTDGTYTAVIMERDPKYVASDLEGFEQIRWFETGGVEGIPPLKYSFLTFEFREFAECCSSVVFLPGMKGSVLKEGGDTLWPPTIFSNDIPQLALTEDGESVNSVVVDGVLESFLGTSIYDGFVSFMDDLVTDGDINDWKPMAYDWRYSPEKILADGIATPAGTIDLLEKIEILAANSETGKVTIIAHSMGGFLGKAVIKELEDQGKAGLIDSFVMVGTPQLGTPQAISSLLHGDGEGILGGLIVKRDEIREIAQNMLSAYNLLPSSLYFDRVPDPVILFNEDASFTEDWRDFWGDATYVYADFFDFLTGMGIPRLSPDQDDLLTPEVLDPDFLTDAAIFHNTYDNYIFPDLIRVVQVAGWGLPTVKAIEYRDEHSEPSYRIKTTAEGDSTVVYPSAISSFADETYFFNLSAFNTLDDITDYQHRDLLSAPPVQSILRLFINNNDISGIDFITSDKPPITEIGSQLIVSTHSPVVLGAYDGLGNFTGIDPSQDLFADILLIREEIPGSSFISAGGSYYIFLPKNGDYEFVFKSVGEGPTTVTIQDFSGEITTDLASYSDILVGPNTSATFEIFGGITDGVVINVDQDGDNVIDLEINSDSTLSLEELLQEIENNISNLDVNSLQKKLLNDLDKIMREIDLIKDNSLDKVIQTLDKAEAQINEELSKNRISEGVADVLLSLIEEIRNKL